MSSRGSSATRAPRPTDAYLAKLMPSERIRAMRAAGWASTPQAGPRKALTWLSARRDHGSAERERTGHHRACDR